MNVAVSPDLLNCILWHPVSCLLVFTSIHLPGMVVSTWLCWREGSSGTGVGACPAAAVWSPSPLSPDSVVGPLYSSHNAALVCVGEPLALISSKLQSSWTYKGDQRIGEKKILLQFPIGKHSLTSLDIQQWGTDGRRLGKVRRWILHALQPVVCSEVTLLQEAPGLYPSKCLLWFGLETIINEVGRRAKREGLATGRKPQDDRKEGRGIENDIPSTKGRTTQLMASLIWLHGRAKEPEPYFNQ